MMVKKVTVIMDTNDAGNTSYGNIDGSDEEHKKTIETCKFFMERAEKYEKSYNELLTVFLDVVTALSYYARMYVEGDPVGFGSVAHKSLTRNKEFIEKLRDAHKEEPKP